MILLFFSGQLSARPTQTHSSGDSNLFTCIVCDTTPFHLSLSSTVPGPGGSLLFGPPASFSFPDQNNNPTLWRADLSARLSSSSVPPLRNLLAETFAPWEPGDILPLPQSKQNSPKKRKKKRKDYSPTATTGSPGHIFWVIPAFKVNYANGFQPLTPKEKFEEWAQSSYDPMGLGVGAFEAATLEYSSTDGFCGYGQGWGGYGECFGSLELDATDSSFIGDFVLPVVLHQDPRYFRLGKGSFRKRAWYAISRVFVTYSDSGRTVFYSSALSGTVIAAGLSNLYYPSQDVGLSHTMTRIAIDLGNTALYNLAAEFWPDIDHRVHRAF